ncbi:hypothetical protein AVEN_271454-1 [Araneus ventricosus]|uniref:Uncharacterized protein n=1 Tax=Araneus ventricosus TaxID=182803 RepID=A0A4Y2P4L1_ARAVE|nr:hypothetical protein AVEN_271454-1 [Araneus ventricosus]
MHHGSSLAVSQILKNSVSMNDRVTDLCLAVRHETGALQQKTICPYTEILSSLKDAKSASENAFKETSEMLPMSRLRCLVLCRYPNSFIKPLQ